MAAAAEPGQIIRFGVFELDLRAAELSKQGHRIRLQDQPFTVLTFLLEHANEVVTREELQKKLWPSSTFVDFDHGLNTAINKIREALGDSAESPRFVETIPRRGYRFIAPVQIPQPALGEMKGESESGKLAGIPAARRKWLRWWPWAVAAALLVAALLVWRLREVAEPGDLRAVTLTSYSGRELEPSFSPDGNKVAFVWNGEKEDNQDIYVKQIGSPGTPMRLTTSPAADIQPAWSPDDRWIAFGRAQPGKVAVMLIPPLGGPERTLIEETYSGSRLSWTPDGKWLAFSARDSPQGSMGIWMVSVETGERRRLTTFLTKSEGAERPLGDYCASISPDGRTLAFARQVSRFVFELRALALTRDLRPDGEPRLVTNQRYAIVNGIAWTADGREIVYAAGGTASQSLWRVPISGRRAPKRLPFAFPAAIFPAIARRPPRLAYTWFVFSLNWWRLDTRTGERRMLIGSTYDSARPQYSPDGRKIAFQSTRSGDWEVWTCDADGSNCLQLTSFGGPACGTPRWSPDSRWLALDSRSEGQPEVYVMAADGGTPRRMTDHPANDIFPSWSSDGRWIYFTSDRGGQYQLWKMPKDGGQAVQVTRSGGYRSFESPDGKQIYYSKFRQRGVFRMPVGGGEEVQVLPVGGDSLNFGVTAKGVYFMPDARTIRFLDTATGKVRTLAILDKPGFQLAVSPDDAYVVWVQPERNTRDLMLVENFH